MFLHGSDRPVSAPAALRALGLTDDEERAILHDNALEMLRRD